MSAPTDTEPLQVPVSVTEEFPLAVNLAPSLPIGASATSLTSVTLVDIASGTAVSISPSPTLAANVVIVVLNGSNLTVGNTYLLRISFAAGTDTVLSTTTQIVATS